MAKVEIRLNCDGVRDLLRSQEMKTVCEGYANNALERLGPGYTVTTMTGKKRVNASIYAESYQARRDNMKNNTILKALR